MTKEDLKLIFIRAQDKQGNWNSMSLHDLLDMGQLGQQQVSDWLIQKLVTHVFNMQGSKITPELVAEAVTKLEGLGAAIVRINPEKLKVSELNDPLHNVKN